MALTQEARNETLKIKRTKFAEKELRHRVRPGIEQAIRRIKERAAKIETSELLQVAIMKMDKMSDEELREFLSYPRHGIMVSEIVAQAIYDAGVRNIMSHPDRDESDEIVAPQ